MYVQKKKRKGKKKRRGMLLKKHGWRNGGKGAS